MKHLFVYALLAVAIPAQQTQMPQTPQAQPEPCVTTSTAPNPSANNPTFKIPSGWRQKFAAKTGITLPDGPISSPQPGTSKPVPCPPQPATPKTTQPVSFHLPTGVITTWLCNPIVTSTDPSHTVTFVTPDELTSAEPAQAGAFEADGAKADPKATISCANLRRDPKTNRVFLAQ
jgi:hypothetical protein